MYTVATEVKEGAVRHWNKISVIKKAKRNTDAYRVTPREFQRGLFLSSIREELGKIADAHSKVITAARAYAADGMDELEVRELLTIDGYNVQVIDGCMERLAAQPVSNTAWGFELEDAYGRLVSNADMQIHLEAASEDEAIAQAEQIVAEGDADRVVRVFRIG